jgi:hypothetical protein
LDTRGPLPPTSRSPSGGSLNVDAGLGPCATCTTDDYIVASGTKLGFSAKNVILANGWNANGPGSQDDYSTAAGKKIRLQPGSRPGPSSLLQPDDGIIAGIIGVLKVVALVFFRNSAPSTSAASKSTVSPGPPAMMRIAPFFPADVRHHFAARTRPCRVSREKPSCKWWRQGDLWHR